MREIDKNCRMDFMSPVSSSTATPWCSRLIATAKENGDPRLVVEVIRTILDAKDGYHSIPLAPESRVFTTFICEWGRVWYLRAPQGWKGSCDAYTHRVDKITIYQAKRRIVFVGGSSLHDRAYVHTKVNKMRNVGSLALDSPSSRGNEGSYAESLLVIGYGLLY